MDYFFNVWDKTIKFNNKSNFLLGQTHNELEKSIWVKHTIEKFDFLHIDEKRSNHYSQKNSIYVC